MNLKMYRDNKEQVKKLTILLLMILMAGIDGMGQDTGLQIREVVINNDSILFSDYDNIGSYEMIILSNQYKDISFEFYGDSEQSYYSFYLMGNDDKWTEWTRLPIKEYTNLKSGDYVFMARKGFGGTILSEEEILTFRIDVPVYLRTVFIFIYFVLFIIIIWYLNRFSVRRHIKEQLRLERIIQERTEELTAEKERTETLLTNVLPKGTADEILSKGKATKRKYNFATVLFSDIQGFTRIAEEINPEILIDELDKFFFYFDSVVGEHNIEKIKTIGDAYMCAGGIPQENRTNPVEVTLAALEMQIYMRSIKEEKKALGQLFWDIRIGIHTGTVIAGVVGQKKLSYDIWGDTVNTASRMESSSEAGKINISGVTYDYVKDFFICEYRGKMPVKYKGKLDMYFVNGIRPELRLEGKNTPNETFINRMLMLKLLDLEDEVFELFEKEASEDLLFHNLRHLKNISTQAELIGRAEQINDNEMVSLRLASIFLHIGLLKDYNKPCNYSITYLEEIAGNFGFGQDHITEASSVISDCIKKKPGKKCGKILNDAMMDYYGRIDFIVLTKLLLTEKKKFGKLNDKKKWIKSQIKKVGEHEFITGTARLLRTMTLQEQIKELSEL
jgi:class 3 adenylate cyclase